MKSEHRAKKPEETAFRPKNSGRKTSVRTYGERNSTNWVPLDNYQEYLNRGGHQTDLAVALGIGRGQLRQWINHHEFKRCIPRVLFSKAKEHIDKVIGLGKAVASGPGAKPSKAAEAPQQVIFAPTDDVFRRDDEYGEAFLYVGNNPTSGSSMPADIKCRVILRCKPIGAKRWIGIANAQIRVDVTEAGTTPLVGAAQSWSEAGALFQRDGGGRYIVVNIRSGGAFPLILNALEGSDGQPGLIVFIGSFVGPKPGDRFIVRLLTSFQDGFVWGPGPIPTDMSALAGREPEFEHINKTKLFKHSAKLASGLAPDAEIVDLSKDVWYFKKVEDR